MNATEYTLTYRTARGYATERYATKAAADEGARVALDAMRHCGLEAHADSIRIEEVSGTAPAIAAATHGGHLVEACHGTNAHLHTFVGVYVDGRRFGEVMPSHSNADGTITARVRVPNGRDALTVSGSASTFAEAFDVVAAHVVARFKIEVRGVSD